MTKFIFFLAVLVNHNFRLKKILLIVILCTAMFALNSCTRANFERIPPLVLQHYQIYAPKQSIYTAAEDFNCFKNASNTGAKIKFTISVTSSVYWTDSDRNYYLHELDRKSVTVTPTIGFNGFPVDIWLNVSSDETDTFVEFNMQGDECSTCANGLSDNSEIPYGKCDFFQIPNSVPASYRAAKPRWTATGVYRYGYSTTTQTIGFLNGLSIGPALTRIVNLPNSCGCTVN
jgi:hypothetical protein